MAAILLGCCEASMGLTLRGRDAFPLSFFPLYFRSSLDLQKNCKDSAQFSISFINT